MNDSERTDLLIINQYASTPAYSTGAGERFYYLAPYLAQAGFHVSVLSGSFNHLFVRYPETPKLFNMETIPGGNFFWVRLRKYRGENFLGRLYSWFEFLFKLFLLKHERPPRIVLVSSMSLFPVIYGYYLKRRFGSSLILEVRDIWPLTPMELGGYSKNHPFIAIFRLLEKFAYRKADALVSVLPGFKEHVREVIGREKEVAWIPNAISVETADPPPDAGDSEFQLPAAFNVVYAGAIGIANALDVIIEAAVYLAGHPDICICIMGDGPEKNNLEYRVREMGLSNVQFFPKVRKNEVPFVLSKADVCLISWRNRKLYRFGVSANKYNDYMLAGKPVISASGVQGDPARISGGGIQVEPENPLKLAEAIERVYRMTKEERDCMGEAGRKFVLANQTYDRIAEKYLVLLNSLAWK